MEELQNTCFFSAASNAWASGSWQVRVKPRGPVWSTCLRLIWWSLENKKRNHITQSQHAINYTGTRQRIQLSFLQGERPLAVRHCLHKTSHMFCLCRLC